MNFIPLIKSLAIIYLLLCVDVYVFQRTLIYHPAEESDHEFEVIKLAHQDNILEVLVTHQATDNVILYFGGNAENVAYAALEFKHHFPDHRTYLMKYRGYAGAQGSPSEQALFADALALFDHLRLNSEVKISVIGRSLGSGVATYLATQRPIDKLVLITPFDSIRHVAQNMLPIFPVNWLLKDHYDSKSRAHEIVSPTLVITANNDQVIPRIHTESLIQSIPPIHLTTTYFNAGHNDLDLIPEYFSSIKSFFMCQEQC